MSLSLLRDKVAIITGATRGIGFSIVKEFAENNGATTIVCSRTRDQAELAVLRIKGKSFAMQVDVTDGTSVRECTQEVLSQHGKIDILVNNAGYPI